MEFPNANSSPNTLMGTESVIQVEMDSVIVQQEETTPLPPDTPEELPPPPSPKADLPFPEIPDPAPVALTTENEDDLPPPEITAPSPLPPPPEITPAPAVITTTTTGLQIITRKRSSLCGTSNTAGLPAPASAPEPAKQESTAATKEEIIAPPPPKKKKKYVPKPKNPTATTKTTKKSSSGSSKSKSKKSSSSKSKKGNGNVKLSENADGIVSNPEKIGSEEKPVTEPDHPPLPPLKLQLPKLTKMPSQIQMPLLEPMPPILARVKEEPLDGDNEDYLGEGDAFQSLQQEAGDGGKSGNRKKKSKGRNGNIYIGVFNRIEWMKLQEDFGFQTVNNFGTFVLQTMRKIHGDISFWCDLAKASAIYPDLEKYVWTNGFPHAFNTEGQTFSPPEVQLPDEKRDEVVELAKTMWEQRLQQLQLQQQFSQNGEGGSGTGGNGVVVLPDADEGEEEDDEEAEDPGIENYIENMANGEYAAVDDAGETLTAEQVNMIWNAQMNNAHNFEHFGKLFSFVNGIQCQQAPENALEQLDEDEEMEALE